MPAAAERHDALLSSRVVHGVRRSGGHTGAATAAVSLGVGCGERVDLFCGAHRDAWIGER